MSHRSLFLAIIVGFNHDFISFHFLPFHLNPCQSLPFFLLLLFFFRFSFLRSRPLFPTTPTNAPIFLLLHSARGTARRLDSRSSTLDHRRVLGQPQPVFCSAFLPSTPIAAWPAFLFPAHLARQRKAVHMPERAPCDAQQPLDPAAVTPLAVSDSEYFRPMQAICPS